MIIIDYKDRRPIYEQMVDRFQELILKGVLEPDSQLPSVRNLAMDLSINPNTIQRGYAELEKKGYIYSVQGKGSFVSENKELLECRKLEILDALTEIVKEAKDMGIAKEQLVIKINEGYKGGISHD